MIKIFIDTTEFKQDSSRLGKSFGQLSALCQLGYIQVHISIINVREIETTIQEHFENLLSITNDGLTKATAFFKNDSQIELLEQHKQKNIDLINQSKKIAIEKFKSWLQTNKVIIHDIEHQDALNVVNGYFTGSSPFKKIKNREDFPDAFIWESLIRLNKDCEGKFYFISGDNNFRAKVDAHLPTVKVLNSLKDFLETSEVLQLIEEKDNFAKQANIEALKELIKLEMTVQKKELSNEMSKLIERELIGTEYYDVSEQIYGQITDIRFLEDVDFVVDYIQISEYPTVYIIIENSIDITVSSSHPIAKFWNFTAPVSNLSQAIQLNENSTDTHEIIHNDLILEIRVEFTIELKNLDIGSGKEGVIDAFEENEINLIKLIKVK